MKQRMLVKYGKYSYVVTMTTAVVYFIKHIPGT